MLCSSCNTARTREFAEKVSLKQAVDADKVKTTTTRSSNKTLAATSSSSSASSSTKKTPSVSVNNVTVPVNERQHVVINELLSYITYYRDKGNAAGLHKITCSFFTAAEISTAKKRLIDTFKSHVIDCPYIIERRNSTARQAYDAELEDVLGILETLDDKDILKNVVFAAANLDRVPRYGPEEINICSVVDRQCNMDTKLEQLSHELTEVRHRDETLTELMARVKDLDVKMTSLVDVISDQSKLQQQQAVGSTSVYGHKVQHHSADNNQQSAQTPPVDRSRNIIVFGITESKDVDEWRKKLNDVLLTVTGRDVQIDDAFRLGKYNTNNSNARPILVRLHNVWDRRILLSNAWVLSRREEFKRTVFIRPDEPVENRRRNALNALYERACRTTSPSKVQITDDKLFVDGKLIYSIKDGRNKVENFNNISVHDDV